VFKVETALQVILKLQYQWSPPTLVQKVSFGAGLGMKPCTPCHAGLVTWCVIQGPLSLLVEWRTLSMGWIACPVLNVPSKQ
jgi:hypothetical protein